MFSIIFLSLDFSGLLAAGTSTDLSEYRGRLTIRGKKCPYYRNFPLNRRNESVTRAIIVIHGTKRNADSYFNNVMKVTRKSKLLSTTAILAPRFQVGEEAQKDEYYWPNGGWKQGNYSKNKGELGRLSSFGVVVHLLSVLNRQNSPFPNLKRVVLVGHSAGGQFLNRFVSRVPLLESESAVVMNPSSYLYLDGRRKLDNGKFGIPQISPVEYNKYKYGLLELNDTMKRFDRNQIRETMYSAKVHYLAGTKDNDTKSKHLEKSLPARMQGKQRFDRWKTYREYVQLFPKWKLNATFEAVPNVGHSSGKMLQSSQVQAKLFYSSLESNSKYAKLSTKALLKRDAQRDTRYFFSDTGP